MPLLVTRHSSCREIKMLLIIWFLALVAAGDVLSYLVGLFVEYEWGSYPSWVVILSMYGVTLYCSVDDRSTLAGRAYRVHSRSCAGVLRLS